LTLIPQQLQAVFARIKAIKPAHNNNVISVSNRMHPMKKIKLFALCACLFAMPLLANQSLAEPVTITTANGILVGDSQDNIHRFKGVPYARPPVGKSPIRIAQTAAVLAATAVKIV